MWEALSARMLRLGFQNILTSPLQGSLTGHKIFNPGAHAPGYFTVQTGDIVYTPDRLHGLQVGRIEGMRKGGPHALERNLCHE